MTLSIIAAVSANNVIGRDGHIPWHMADDYLRYKSMVRGKTLIMGSGTWRSHKIKHPNAIVISHTLEDDRCTVVPTVAHALRLAEGDTFVLGGESIFPLVIPIADSMYLTRIHAHVEGDRYFPVYDPAQWQLTLVDTHLKDEYNEYDYSYMNMVKANR